MGRIGVWMFVACISMTTLAVADERAAIAELSAAQIVEKNVAARGGLEAWRKIESMVWVGHIERADTSITAAPLPFTLEMRRPGKTRFEIKAQYQMAVRIFDGIHGWKLNLSRSGQPELQPYTTEELRFAQNGFAIDGPLVDYQAKGIKVTLEGLDEIEGHRAYRLNVQPPSGGSNHVWVDAQTFLDIKYDRASRNAQGVPGSVSVYYRNYQTIDGLQIPLMLENGRGTNKVTDKMVIDRVMLNPPLDKHMFDKPRVPEQRHAVDRGSPKTLRSVPSWPEGLPKSNLRSVSGSAGWQ